MERRVKERLVGAAVLMAAAIVLIPEMLSGHRASDADAEQPAQARNDAPIKTYTIDLSQSHAAQAAPAVVDNRAPPPETPPAPEPSNEGSESQPAAGDQVKPEVPEQSAVITLPPETVRSEPSTPVPNGPVVEQPTPTPAPVRSAARPLASEVPAPTSGRWAVQIGSYAREATAERIAKQLRDKGQSALVMPVKSGGATLSRGRIGPMKDRASAEAVWRDVKSAGAAIVSHP